MWTKSIPYKCIHILISPPQKACKYWNSQMPVLLTEAVTETQPGDSGSTLCPLAYVTVPAVTAVQVTCQCQHIPMSSTGQCVCVCVCVCVRRYNPSHVELIIELMFLCGYLIIMSPVGV